MPKVRHIESNTWLDVPEDIFKRGSLAINEFANQHVRAKQEAAAALERERAEAELAAMEAEKSAVVEATDLRAIVMEQSEQIKGLMAALQQRAPDQAFESAVALQTAAAQAQAMKSAIFDDLQKLEAYRTEHRDVLEAIKEQQKPPVDAGKEQAQLNKLMFSKLRAGQITQEEFDNYLQPLVEKEVN